MPSNEDLVKTTREISTAIAPVIDNLQARSDYGKSQTQYGSIKQFKDVVAVLNGFHRTLLSYQMSSSPTAGDLTKAMDQAKTVKPLLTGLIDGNRAMSRMQPLNTNRTIEPKVALAHNKTLEALYDTVQNFIAQSEATQIEAVQSPVQTPSLDPESTKSEHPGTTQGLETYATLANGTPFNMTLITTIENASDWASNTDRPDMTLGGPDGLPVVLDAFSSVPGRVDISAKASTAKYQVKVAVDDDEGNTETFSFTCDQSVLRNPPKEEAYTVIEAKSDAGRNYFVYQSVVERPDGKPELAMDISDKGV